MQSRRHLGARLLKWKIRQLVQKEMVKKQSKEIVADEFWRQLAHFIIKNQSCVRAKARKLICYPIYLHLFLLAPAQKKATRRARQPLVLFLQCLCVSAPRASAVRQKLILLFGRH